MSKGKRGYKPVSSQVLALGKAAGYAFATVENAARWGKQDAANDIPNGRWDGDGLGYRVYIIAQAPPAAYAYLAAYNAVYPQPVNSPLLTDED